MTGRNASRDADLGVWSIALGGIVFAVLLGLVAASGTLAMMGAAVAAVLVVMTLVIPKLAVVILVVQSFFLQHFVTLGQLPHATIWLPDLVIATLLIRLIAIRIGAKRPLVLPRGLVIAIAVLAAVCLVSAALGGQGPLAMVAGLRFYVKYPLLFFVLLNTEIDPKFYKHLFVGFVMIAAVQVPLSAYQFLLSGSFLDANSGTLGAKGGQDLLFLALTAMTIVLSLVVLGRLRAIYGVVALGFLMAPLFASVRATLVLGPMVLVLVLVRGLLSSRGRRVGRVAAVALVAVAAIYLAVGTSSIVESAVSENSFSRIGGFVGGQQSTDAGTPGRITAIRQAMTVASVTPMTLMLGHGPGSASTSRLAYGHLYESTTFLFTRTQVSVTLPELGLAGLGALCLVAAAAWRTTMRARYGHGPMGDALICSGPVIVLLYFLMLGYFGAWTDTNATPLLFWLLMAAICVIDREPGDAGLASRAANT